jgi:hypothetical protein
MRVEWSLMDIKWEMVLALGWITWFIDRYWLDLLGALDAHIFIDSIDCDINIGSALCAL